MLEQQLTAFIISRGGSINCSHIGELMAAINAPAESAASDEVDPPGLPEPKPRKKKSPTP